MRIKQISIFLENKIGRLKEVASILAEANINIRALTLSDTSDFGILRILVDNHEKAEKVLRDQGFTMSITEVLAVEVKDKPGGLRHLLGILEQNSINVEYLYAFVKNSGETAVNIFRFDNLEEATKALQKNGVNIIKAVDLFKL